MRRRMPVCAVVVMLMAATAAHAQTNKGSAPNGKPFQALQTQIDALDARLTATETSIADLEAAWQAADTRFEEQGGTLQSLIEADRALQELIDALKDQGDEARAQIEALTLELGEKQAAILQACSPGSSIRQVNADGTVACEIDDASTGGGSVSFVTTDFSTANLTVIAGGTRVATLFCPSGYHAVSGGYIKGAPAIVMIDIPDGNGWRVSVSNPSATDTFVRVFVRCVVP